MNFNISFSSFQETGQTGTKILLSLVQSPDETALNKQDDKVNLFHLQFDYKVFNALLKHLERPSPAHRNPFMAELLPLLILRGAFLKTCPILSVLPDITP